MPENFFTFSSLALAAILLPLSLKQRRTLVPAFESEPWICEAPFVRLGPLVWLGPWARAVHYSFVLAGISMLPAHLLERKGARFEPFSSKMDFMKHFSSADVRRSQAYALLSSLLILCITLSYFLEVP